MLRDDIGPGDAILFYHARIDLMYIAGTATVVREGYPDHYVFQSGHRYFDPKSYLDQPPCFMVDIRLVRVFEISVTRHMLRENSKTACMKVLAKDCRLSITPVTAAEWKAVHALAGVKPQAWRQQTNSDVPAAARRKRLPPAQAEWHLLWNRSWNCICGRAKLLLSRHLRDHGSAKASPSRF